MPACAGLYFKYFFFSFDNHGRDQIAKNDQEPSVSVVKNYVLDRRYLSLIQFNEKHRINLKHTCLLIFEPLNDEIVQY